VKFEVAVCYDWNSKFVSKILGGVCRGLSFKHALTATDEFKRRLTAYGQRGTLVTLAFEHFRWRQKAACFEKPAEEVLMNLR
jgi:hypothetical protein